MFYSQERFGFRREPLKGVTPTLLAKLYDICFKWGKVVPKEQLAIYQSGDIGLEFELFIKIIIGTERDHLMISKESIGLIVEGKPTNNGFVEWDINLSAQEAQDAILRIDENERKRGLIDQRGIRIPLKPEDSFFR